MIKNFLHGTFLVNNYKRFQLPYCTLVNSKIFMNYIKPESDPRWLVKGDLNKCSMYIKSINCAITLHGKINRKSIDKIHIVSLLPMKFWLVFEKDTAILFEKSELCKILKEQMTNNDPLNHILTSSALVNLLTSIRPTARIIRIVDCPQNLLFYGQVKPPQDKNNNDSSVFVPYNKGIPHISVDGNHMMITDKLDRLCRIIDWKYDEDPTGILLPPPSHPPSSNPPPDNTRETYFVAMKPDCDSSVPPVLVNNNINITNISPSPPQKNNNYLSETIDNLLKLYRLRDCEFSEEEMSCCPVVSSDYIYSEEISNRKRFTDKCIISIDPDDAKDIDDALHVENMQNGNYLVGVHIADVSHFVRPNTPLDNAALKRASSIYLKHRVIPMLPSILSENLCSLNPNEDKLAFTVMLLINSEGMVISETFMKSVIRPKMKLSYKEANALIDGEYNQDLALNPFYEEAVETLKILDKLATINRNRRGEAGALILQKPTIIFKVESDKIENDSVPEPIGFEAKLSGKSNFLIEEFMLLANEASAKLLFNNLLSSDSQIGAFLRRHPSPDKSRKYRWFSSCQRAGFTPKSMQPNSIMEYINNLRSKSNSKAIGLSFITYLHMELALYCCAENNISLNDPDQEIKIINDSDFPFHHYGLNVPLYTHFTSPIRRYGDIVVHRQISAILEGATDCGMYLSQRLEAAHNCNLSRMANRRMNDALTSIYMAAFLNKTGWRLTKVLILINYDDTLKLLLPSLGILHKCELHEFAPWSTKLSETIFLNKGLPMKISFKYSSKEENYIFDNEMGFPRYKTIFTCGASDTIEMRMNDLIQQNDKEYQRLIVKKFSEMQANQQFRTFDVGVLEEIDCLIYCQSKELKLVVELPFPPMLPLLKEDSSRLL